MSVYISFDGGKPRFIASNSGWAEFCRWVTGAARSGSLRHLADWGWVEPASACLDQLRQMMGGMGGDVRSIASLLQEQLRGMDDAVVTINQGVKAEKLIENAADQPRDDKGRFAHSVGGKVERAGFGVGEVTKLDKKGVTGSVKVGGQEFHKQDMSKWQQHDPVTSVYTRGAVGSVATRKDSSPQPEQRQAAGSAVEHSVDKDAANAKHVVEAVLKHGGDMVPMTKVRAHMAEAGITDRNQQDAAIQHARGKHVTGSNFEGRHGISETERDAMLRDGDDRIGYLSLKR